MHVFGKQAMSQCVVLIFIALCISGCAHHTRVIVSCHNTYGEVSSTLKNNASGIINNCYPPELKPFEKVYSTSVEYHPGKHGDPCSVNIDVKYTGGGGLFWWSVSSSYERDIAASIVENASGVKVHCDDARSPFAPPGFIGFTFADAAVPYLYESYSGSVELNYEDGALYSKGEVINGMREGEWIWLYRNGDIMQRSNYHLGKLQGKRVYYVKYKQGYTEYNLVY